MTCSVLLIPARSREELGWQSCTLFAEGLRATVEWYRANRPWTERVITGEYRDYYRKIYGACSS